MVIDAKNINPTKQPALAGLLEAEAETNGGDSHRVELGKPRCPVEHFVGGPFHPQNRIEQGRLG